MDINEIPIPEAPAAEATGCETPPSPPQAPQWNPAGPPVKERRVGRLTLGVTLIATGVVLLLTMFVPGFSLFTVAKFAPVILILIGVEILVNVCVARGVRLRYDFLSMFVCFLLICGSLCVSAVPMRMRITGANFATVNRLNPGTNVVEEQRHPRGDQGHAQGQPPYPAFLHRRTGRVPLGSLGRRRRRFTSSGLCRQEPREWGSR